MINHQVNKNNFYHFFYSILFISADATGTNTQTTKRRKRRFGDETERVFLPNMPTSISTSNMTEQQQKIYICKSIRFSIN